LTAEELGEVLPAWALGEVRSAVELRGGASGSPKALVTCARGRFVLKRRTGPSGVPARVAVSHEAQLWAGRAGVPVARLIAARDGNTLVVRGTSVYELSVYVEGRAYAMRAEQAASIGRTLAEVHRALRAFAPVSGRLAERGRGWVFSAEEAGLMARCDAALGGSGAGALRPIHGDVHPGNLAFVGDRVVCVFDFDRVCLGTEAEELGQACAQASLAHGAAVFAPGLAGAVWAGYARACAQTGSVVPIPASCVGAAMARAVLAEVGAGALDAGGGRGGGPGGGAGGDVGGRRRLAMALAESMLDACGSVERHAVHWPR
jgi:Ser/Thr protein kinase RdoA (MazF antagonist)